MVLIGRAPDDGLEAWDRRVEAWQPGETRGGFARQWGLRPDESAREFEALRTGRLSAGSVSEQPWAALVERPDGVLAAAASSTLKGGLFWTVDRPPRGRPTLLFGVRLGEVVGARTGRTRLNDRYVADVALMSPSAEETAYLEVHRLAPGTALLWSDPESVPRRVTWCGPDAWPAPTRSGDGVISDYLAAFDAAVDELVVPGEPLVATLSGGLDSSFVVASLVRHATPDSPVHAFMHVPHPDAGLGPRGNWDADDSGAAAEMQRAYPGRIVLTAVSNDGSGQPLDAAADNAERSWSPTVNPANQAWMTDFSQRAAALGASRFFEGSNGNAAFSYEHGYAAGYHLRRGELGRVADLVRLGRADGLSWPGALRHRVLGPIASPIKAGLRRGPHEYATAAGLVAGGPTGRPPATGRAGYLRWLRMETGLLATVQPGLHGTVTVDPFTAASVLDLAASIVPAEWSRGPRPRGYARLLGAGRVPDAIRLRTRRGGQSWDNWFLIRNQRERYLDELAALPGTPVVGGMVDADLLRRRAEAWPWGETIGPSHADVTATDRILSLAAFVRMTTTRLAGLPQ